MTLEVETYLKGDARRRPFSSACPAAGSAATAASSSARREFAVGQRIIVFLGARGPSVPYVLGLGQGVFRLVASRARLDRDAAAVAPRRGRACARALVRGDLARRPLALVDVDVGAQCARRSVR